MMNSDSYKYWASNRGWISAKFAVKNPVTHFLNLYKKKQPQSKPQKVPQQSQKYFSAQKPKILTQKTQKNSRTQPKISIQPQPAKPQTAPHNYTINSSIFLQKQIQRKTKDIHLPKRNGSLHMKKAKKLQDEIKGLKEMNSVMTKIKDENEVNNYQQKNFRATNCGRYKPQMIFLQPQIRAGTASAKLGGSMKAYEEFQRRKTTIYKQINMSMDVDHKIFQFQKYKRSTSVGQYQPIEYMTEYGCEQNEEQISLKQNCSTLRQSLKYTNPKTFKRKPNLSVLRNKLNLHYKKSHYKDKICNMTMEPELTDMSFYEF